MDINIDEDDDEESDDEGSDTETGGRNGDDIDHDNGKQEIDESNSYSSENEDSDWYIISFIFCLLVFDFVVI